MIINRGQSICISGRRKRRIGRTEHKKKKTKQSIGSGSGAAGVKNRNRRRRRRRRFRAKSRKARGAAEGSAFEWGRAATKRLRRRHYKHLRVGKGREAISPLYFRVPTAPPTVFTLRVPVIFPDGGAFRRFSSGRRPPARPCGFIVFRILGFLFAAG